MNERLKELKQQAGIDFNPDQEGLDLFAELIVKECADAVLSVPCYYKDYRSQIEEAVINDCGRAVLEHFGVEE